MADIDKSEGRVTSGGDGGGRGGLGCVEFSSSNRIVPIWRLVSGLVEVVFVVVMGG